MQQPECDSALVQSVLSIYLPCIWSIPSRERMLPVHQLSMLTQVRGSNPWPGTEALLQYIPALCSSLIPT